MPILSISQNERLGTDRTVYPATFISYLAHCNAALEAVQKASEASGSVTWTEEEIVFLHCLLLCKIKMLKDPMAPISEALDVLLWIFTEPEKHAKPFSFANCIRIAESHRESTFPFLGKVDQDNFRTLLRGYLRKWLPPLLARFPVWVREAILGNPVWAARRLEINTQCINQKLSLLNVQGDLFA
jgi:hypothetical protein